MQGCVMDETMMMRNRLALRGWEHPAWTREADWDNNLEQLSGNMVDAQLNMPGEPDQLFSFPRTGRLKRPSGANSGNCPQA